MKVEPSAVEETVRKKNDTAIVSPPPALRTLDSPADWGKAGDCGWLPKAPLVTELLSFHTPLPRQAFDPRETTPSSNPALGSTNQPSWPLIEPVENIADAKVSPPHT